MEIKENFNNNNNLYYGHGTSVGNGGKDKIVDSIFETGLRCKDNSPTIYFTSICLGEGSKSLFDESSETLNNWKHNNSKNIIVASVPKNMIFNQFVLGNLAHFYREAAFCYSIPKEDGGNDYYLKPEFIKGCYDAEHKTFIENERYYENLPKEEQEKLQEDVKATYVDTLVECAKGQDLPFSSFAECQQDVTNTFGEEYKSTFSEDEIMEIDSKIVEAYKQREVEEVLKRSFKQESPNQSNMVDNKFITQEDLEFGEEGWN